MKRPGQISFLLAALVPFYGCSPTNEADAKSGTTEVGAVLPYVATSVGRVDSETEARQLVAAADGVIARIFVARGQRVRAGQLLLKVDCDPRHAEASARKAEAQRQNAAAQSVIEGARAQEVDAAHNAVLSAEAARDDAQDRLNQAELLAQQGFVSRRDLAARKNDFAIMDATLARIRAEASLVVEGPRMSDKRAAVASARAARDQAEAADALARQCDLLSPIDGDVLQIFRREGEFSGASQGTALIAVGDLSRLLVRAEISERDAARVRVGQPADVWIEGDRQRWSGRITSLARVMGRRSARSLDPTDRFDRDVREAFVTLDGTTPPALVGLRVMVGIKP